MQLNEKAKQVLVTANKDGKKAGLTIQFYYEQKGVGQIESKTSCACYHGMSKTTYDIDEDDDEDDIPRSGTKPQPIINETTWIILPPPTSASQKIEVWQELLPMTVLHADSPFKFMVDDLKAHLFTDKVTDAEFLEFVVDNGFIFPNAVLAKYNAGVIQSFAVATRLGWDKPQLLAHLKKLMDLGATSVEAWLLYGLGPTGAYSSWREGNPLMFANQGHWFFNDMHGGTWKNLINGTPVLDHRKESYLKYPAYSGYADITWSDKGAKRNNSDYGYLTNDILKYGYKRVKGSLNATYTGKYTTLKEGVDACLTYLRSLKVQPKVLQAA